MIKYYKFQLLFVSSLCKQAKSGMQYNLRICAFPAVKVFVVPRNKIDRTLKKMAKKNFSNSNKKIFHMLVIYE